MITVEHLTRRYHDLLAVDDISLHVEEGEVLGFLGPNGAGKSTTIKILTGFLPATSGRAEVAGFDVATRSLEARRRLGYLPENVAVPPDAGIRRVVAVTGPGSRSAFSTGAPTIRLPIVPRDPVRTAGNRSEPLPPPDGCPFPGLHAPGDDRADRAEEPGGDDDEKEEGERSGADTALHLRRDRR